MTRVQTPYAEVRSLERGLALIAALAENGWSTPTNLADRTGIDRGTVYRLLATLTRCGFAIRRDGDGSFAPSARLRELASGIHIDDRLVEIVTPRLNRLVETIHWPSDFAILDADRLKIIASTHHLTSMTAFRGMVGKERPIVESALGRAILAAMPDEDLDALWPALLAGQRSSAIARVGVDRLIAQTKNAGYAAAVSSVDPKVSAIALPLMDGRRLAGAINIVFFSSVMTPEQAAGRYLARLQECVSDIEVELLGAG